MPLIMSRILRMLTAPHGTRRRLSKARRGGIASEIQGGSFEAGFRSSAEISISGSFWTHQVGATKGCIDCEGAKASWSPGDGPTAKPYGVAVHSVKDNNWGLKNFPLANMTVDQTMEVLNRTGIPALNEGGWVSVVADHIPGMNAVATLHDSFNPHEGLKSVGDWAWFGASMPVSAAVSYSALLDGYRPQRLP